MNNGKCWAIALYNEQRACWSPGILYCCATATKKLEQHECSTSEEAIKIAEKKIRKSAVHTESCSYYEDPRDTL